MQHFQHSHAMQQSLPGPDSYIRQDLNYATMYCWVAQAFHDGISWEVRQNTVFWPNGAPYDANPPGLTASTDLLTCATKQHSYVHELRGPVVSCPWGLHDHSITTNARVLQCNCNGLHHHFAFQHLPSTQPCLSLYRLKVAFNRQTL